MYSDANYPLGNYPNSGSRGFRSVMGNQTAQGTFNVNNFQYPGIWSGVLNSNYIGRAVNILFDAASSANRMIAFHDNNDPYFGMNCRCVKVKYVDTQNDKLVLYPNPVRNVLYIKGTSGKLYQFQIYNAAGQLVLSGQFKNNQADLSGLSVGVYLVKINNDETITKIIKR
jgi:hypothetical protein